MQVPLFGKWNPIMQRLNRIAIVTACALTLGPVAFAQIRDAGSKIRDEAVQGHEARTYQRHAQDRAQILYYQYAQPQPQVTRQQATETVAAIRKDIKAADTALAKLKAAHAKEPEVVKQIEAIEKHQAKAHEVCSMTEKECAKEHGDHAFCAACCSQMWHELDAAQSETQKLLKMLKLEKLEPPKQAAPKKDAAKKS